MQKRVWITWEHQRRSLELSSAFSCKLYILDYSGLLRYFKCIKRTIDIVKNEKPDVLFVQNPSMILASLSIIMKIIFGCFVVVDRHSNFYLNVKKRISIEELFFRLLSFFSIRFADITIVTNKYLSHVVQVTGGRAYVLHDKIPELIVDKNMSNSDNDFIFMISSFNRDEPIEEVWKAANLINNMDIKIFVSGDPRKISPKNLLKNLPPNVKLTGFLSQDEFVIMLNRATAIIVLTDAEYTLLCGCYEAVAVEKPLITSGTLVLKELFDKAIFVKNNSESIAEGLKEALQKPQYYINETKEMKKKLIINWKHQFHCLDQAVYGLNRKTN